MGTRAYFSMLSLPRSTVGLAVTSKGILCSLTACLRNMLIAWVVLMPSSENSFAAPSLRLPLHAYRHVDRFQRGLLALWARHAAIVRAAGGIFWGFVMI